MNGPNSSEWPAGTRPQEQIADQLDDNNNPISISSYPSSTPSSHSKNKQMLPINTRKRALYSPSSSTPRPTQRDLMKQRHTQSFSNHNPLSNSNLLNNNNGNNNQKTHLNSSFSPLSNDKENMFVLGENNDNFEENDQYLLSPNMAAKKLSIRRSAGFLNLSKETSPDKQKLTLSPDLSNNEVIANRVTRSFTKLNFHSNEDDDNSKNNHNNIDDSDIQSARKPSNLNNTFANLSPVSDYSSSPFLNPTPTQQPVVKKQSTTSKLRKFFGSTSINNQSQSPEIVVSTPFDGKKLSPYESYNKSASSIHSLVDSPSKKPIFKFRSPVSSSSSVSSKQKQTSSNTPSNSTSATSSASSSSPFNHPTQTPSIANKTVFTTANSSSAFITPASFKSVKPLQTAFTSTGLQSKKSMSTLKPTVKQMPETPCKKPPPQLQTFVDSNGSFTNNKQLVQNISLNSTNSPNSLLVASPTYTTTSSRITPKSSKNNSQQNNSHSGGSSAGKKLSRSQRANINTADLQDCILRFTSEFDDYEDSSSSSIFKDNDSASNSQSHNQRIAGAISQSQTSTQSSARSYVTASPNAHNSQRANNSRDNSPLHQHSTNQQDNHHNHHQHQNSQREYSSQSPNGSFSPGAIRQQGQSTGFVNKIGHYSFGTTPATAKVLDKHIVHHSPHGVDDYNDYDPMDEDIVDLKHIDDQNFEGFSSFIQSMDNFPPTPTRLGVVNNAANKTADATSNKGYPVSGFNTPTKLRHDVNSATISSDSRPQFPQFPNPVQRMASFASTTSISMMGPPSKKQNLNIDIHGSPSTPVLSQFDPMTPVEYFTNTGENPSQLTRKQSSLSQQQHPYYENPNDSTSSIPTPFRSQTTLINENSVSIDQHLLSQFGSCTLIGSGEFSNVYEIQYESVKYAVKRTKNPLSGPKTRLRKLEEVEILKTLQENSEQGGVEDENHEYILTLINFWEFNSYLYIMTDCCENGSLDKFLTESGKISKLDEWRVWKILIEILMGLAFIHKCGILHLDLKPANIFITFEGSLKIGDFGLASKLPLPAFFEREGDREYIAPEVISKQMYDKPADIFSVGLIMVEVAANIILPDNGLSWQKLRSGDLTDAGRLSSSDLTDFYNDGTFSNLNANHGIMNSSATTTTSTNTAGTAQYPSSYSSYSSSDHGSSSIKLLNSSYHNNSALSQQLKQKFKIPSWSPKFLINGSGTLDKLVHWMIEPDPKLRPSASEILRSYECQLVDIRRKCGAVVYEGDFGPRPDEIEMNLEKSLDESTFKISLLNNNNRHKKSSIASVNSLITANNNEDARKSSIDMILE